MGKKSLFIALALFLWSNVAFAQSPLAGEYVEGEVLVVFEGTGANASDVSAFKAGLDSSANALASSVGAQSVGTYSAIAAQSGKNIAHFRAEGKTTAELMEELKSQPGVVGVAPNYIFRASFVSADLSADLWGMKDIKAQEAWDISSGDKKVFVAVVDTGIDYNHADLTGNIGRDTSGRRGFNAVANNWDPMDDNGHGTHVAGTIGAVGNTATGMVGVNWNVSLLGVKVLDDDGSGTGDQIIGGLNYVIGQIEKKLNIKVVNMSLGGWGSPVGVNDPYAIPFKSLSDLGVVVVLAAGNEYQHIDNPGGIGSNPKKPMESYRGKLPYPACFPFGNILTVASITSAGSLSDFSNHSPNYVHLAAPGSGILSTKVGGGYVLDWGTSMAAPHVAGVAALIAAKNQTYDAKKIKAQILANVSQEAYLKDKVATGGKLNAYMALSRDFSVSVTPVTAISISGAPSSSVTLEPGATLQLGATIVPSTATNRKINWSSSNTDVATVSPSGLVRATSGGFFGTVGGTTTISARSDYDDAILKSITVSVPSSDSGGGGCTIGLAPATLLLALPLMFLRR